jgi:hypothetical protein
LKAIIIEGQTAGISEKRLPREVGKYVYAIRHKDDDWGEPITIEESVSVNHLADIVFNVPLDTSNWHNSFGGKFRRLTSDEKLMIKRVLSAPEPVSVFNRMLSVLEEAKEKILELEAELNPHWGTETLNSKVNFIVNMIDAIKNQIGDTRNETDSDNIRITEICRGLCLRVIQLAQLALRKERQIKKE